MRLLRHTRTVPPPLLQAAESSPRRNGTDAASPQQRSRDNGAAAGTGNAAPAGILSLSPLQRQLAVARANEEALVSSPSVLRGFVTGPPATLLAAAGKGEALLLIVCDANGKFLAADPEQPAETMPEGVWMACIGEGGAGGDTGGRGVGGDTGGRGVGGDTGGGGDAGGVLATPLGEGLFAREEMGDGSAAFRHVMSGKYMQVCGGGGEEWGGNAAGLQGHR
jgi:hypothetical protein